MAAPSFHQNARLEWNVAARPQIDEVFSPLGYTITASHEGADNLIATVRQFAPTEAEAVTPRGSSPIS